MSQILTPDQKNQATTQLLNHLPNATLSAILAAVHSPNWPDQYHFSFGIQVRNLLRDTFAWSDRLLDAYWAELAETAAQQFEARITVKQALPSLPPRLYSAALAAAENLTAIAHREGVELGGPEHQALPTLVTILYTIRERAIQTERELRPYLSDEMITPQEIAAVLETISHWMVSEGMQELAGYNPSWFSDAANVLERIFQERA